MSAERLLIPLLLIAACARDPAVLFNAPPELDGARVYVDDQLLGTLRATHSYRWGRFARSKEMGGPPRHEANLAVESLSSGTHRLRIVKPGYVEYRATFKNLSSHVEIFVPDDAARRSGG